MLLELKNPMTSWGIEPVTFRQNVLPVTRKGDREKRKGCEDVEDQLQEISIRVG
jgi:hypothetical protein